MNKEDEIIFTINKMIELCEPISKDDLRRFIPAKDDKLLEFEKKYPKTGIGMHDNKYGISTLSIIATITDICVGKRLAFIYDDTDPLHIVKGVMWYKGDEEMD